MTTSRFYSYVLLFAAAGCAKAPANVDDLLALPGNEVDDLDPTGSEPAEARDLDIRGLSARLDAEAARRLAQAEERADEPGPALEASRALFRAADARMLVATLERVEAEPDMPIARLIDINSHLPGELKREVQGLVVEGRRLADVALEHEPESAEARLYLALHASLEGWAVGAGRALMSGLGSSIPRAIRGTLEPDASIEGGAPLRLMGRFLDRAPWPLGDKDEARGFLERAAETSDEPINWLFLGDSFWDAGEADRARAAWERATEATRSDGTRDTAWVHRHLAQLRLDKTAG